MNGELDPNSIVAEFLKLNLDYLVEGAKSVAKVASDRLRLNIDRTYRAYLTTLLDKYSKAKSFLLRGESVPLYRFYVPLNLKVNAKQIPNAGIKDILKVSTMCIITGSAGSGKSMLIRHLLLDALQAKGRVPIFIELRHFNTFEGDLVQLAVRTLTSCGFSMDEDYVKKAITLGHFLLFLDGYDEVSPARRQYVRSTIHGFVRAHDKNAIILTSRPDSELEGWQQFALLQVCPLTLNQAQTLVEKLPFDAELKARFLADLQKDLFSKHHDFLSNPLLLSIMLLSYGQSASIPTKISVFYNQAYEALFERHDVLKDGFRRQRLTPLDIQDFARVYSAFCILSYDKKKLEFSQLEAIEYIEESQAIAGITCNKQDFLTDLIQGVCLMAQEGLSIVFAHRSFQEYFAARFICEAKAEVQEQLITKYKSAVRRDSVFTMLYEMRPELIERYYLSPGLDRLFALIGFKRSMGVTHHARFVRAVAKRFMMGPNGISVRLDQQVQMWILDLTSFALHRCGHLIGWTGYGERPKEKALMAVWQDKLQRMEPKHIEIDIRVHPEAKDFIRELSDSDGWLSLKMLRLLVELRTAMKEKAQVEEKSLRSILGRK